MTQDDLKAAVAAMLEADVIPKWTLSDIAKASGLNYWTLRIWLQKPGAKMQANNRRKMREFLRKERSRKNIWAHERPEMARKMCIEKIAERSRK